jgi:hypothetical protein
MNNQSIILIEQYNHHILIAVTQSTNVSLFANIVITYHQLYGNHQLHLTALQPRHAMKHAQVVGCQVLVVESNI